MYKKKNIEQKLKLSIEPLKIDPHFSIPAYKNFYHLYKANKINCVKSGNLFIYLKSYLFITYINQLSRRGIVVKLVANIVTHENIQFPLYA